VAPNKVSGSRPPHKERTLVRTEVPDRPIPRTNKICLFDVFITVSLYLIAGSDCSRQIVF
jgi:hypothetical protein